MTSAEVNAAGQPLGWRVDGWTAPAFSPSRADGRPYVLAGAARHGARGRLHEANLRDTDGANWTYLPYGPFETLDAYVAWVTAVAAAADPQFHAVIDLATGKPVGVASYLRIDPGAGSIEVGHIHYSPLLQRTIAATEAMY
jgi:RimJ/RimL family protein N-acetyltransferase